MKANTTRYVWIGLATVIVISLLVIATRLSGEGSSSTSTGQETRTPVSGQAIDAKGGAALAAPALPDAAKLGTGWAQAGAAKNATQSALPICLLTGPADSAPASAHYTGPDGTEFDVVSYSQRESTVEQWFGAAKAVTTSCEGTPALPVTPLPSIEGTTNAVGAQIGPSKAWWTFSDSKTHKSSSVLVTMPAIKSPTPAANLWAANVARTALAAANGAQYGALPPLPTSGDTVDIDGNVYKFAPMKPVEKKPLPTGPAAGVDTGGEVEDGEIDKKELEP